MKPELQTPKLLPQEPREGGLRRTAGGKEGTSTAVTTPLLVSQALCAECIQAYQLIESSQQPCVRGIGAIISVDA